jgi:hypothetical protein
MKQHSLITTLYVVLWKEYTGTKESSFIHSLLCICTSIRRKSYYHLDIRSYLRMHYIKS